MGDGVTQTQTARRRAVVTGAAGGIGLALVEALLARGDRVVAADLDADRLADVAERLGIDVWAGDVASEAGVASLIAFADERLGSIDAYFANAGVFRGSGLAASEADWSASIEVNVMAHVRAARTLVPRWSLEQPGVFAVTASAAGLLTQLGSPTYSASKHAAVGFAEWLAATYGDQGVHVSALCPMGVATPMAELGRTTSDPDERLGHRAVVSSGEVLSAELAADVLLQAIDEKRFLALPHETVQKMYAGKAGDPDKWLASMQAFRAHLETTA